MSNLTIEQIIEKIKTMSALDLKDLVVAIEDAFGVTAAAPVVQGNNVPADEPAEAKQPSSIYLKSVGASKMQVIKLVKDKLGKDLMSAKKLVDAVADNNPQLLKDGLSKQDLEDLEKAFKEAGAVVEIK